MFIIISIILIMLFPCIATSACIGESPTWTSASVSLTDIEDCITSASVGDTINVPAGTSTWLSGLSIEKGVKLKGSGIGSTIISGGNFTIITYTPSEDQEFELSGFTLDSKSSGSSAFAFSASGSSAIQTGINVHNNKIMNAYRGISLMGLEAGVFYNNTFQDNYISVWVGGSGDAGWLWSLTQGGANYPFFEDNIFVDTGTKKTDGFTFETGQGGRIVFRYNTISRHDGTGSVGEIFDSHGDQGDRGTVSGEIYGNQITMLDHSHRLFFHRGGKSIFFGNTVLGYAGNIEVTEYAGWWYCDANAYPKDDQINSSYYYDNTSLGESIQPSLRCPANDSCGCLAGSGTCTAGFCNPGQNDSTYIQENRDYWLSEKSGYTPYTYPHPLRGARSGSMTGGQSFSGGTIK